MNGITHIVSMVNAPWCGWTMLVLFLCALFSEVFQPGLLTQAASSLLAKTNRTYKAAPNNFMGQLLVNIFRMGTLGMALCMCFSESSTTHFLTLLIVCGVLLSVLAVKMLCNVIVDYTFQLSRHYMPIYEHYANLMTLAMMVLYPAVLVLMHWGTPLAARWTLGIMAVLFLCMWIYRSARIFLVSPLALVYLIIYILTLEVLPMAGLYILTAQIISRL